MADPRELTMAAAASIGVAVTAAVAVISPLLAAWTENLVHDQRTRWWVPRRVGVRRWLVVCATAARFAALAARGTPVLAWWLLAVTGPVLAVVDARTHRLPARLVGPLAAAEAGVLSVAVVVQDEPWALLRALLAAGAVAGGYFLLAFAAPSALGLGDVYVVGVTGGLLGWAGWGHVLAGQAAVWLLSPITAVAVGLVNPEHRGLRMQVPMGPALVAGSLLACWL